MSSIKTMTASNPVPPDLAKKIGISGINEILALFWTSYRELCDDPTIVITPSSEEDDITQMWYEKLVRRWDSRNRATSITLNQVSPFNQYADKTLKKRKGSKSPTIDFCFKDWETSNSYFGAECKNLYDNKPAKIVRYVQTGVENYVLGRYGSQSSESSIIGYVLTGDIPTLVTELKSEIQKEHPIMNLTRTMSTIEPQYKTQHKRVLDGTKITLHHLFFNFVHKS